MSAEITELQQRLSNVLRIGKVVAVQYDPPRAKVTFGDNTTAFIPWKTARAGDVSEWDPPSIGEQVSIFSPSGELGAAYVEYGAINYDSKPPAGSNAKQRIVILPADGAWKIVVGSASFEFVQDSAKITIGSNVMEIAGGKLTFNGDVEVTGKITATENIETPADVVAGTISLKTHVHGGVQSGGSTTSPPTP